MLIGGGSEGGEVRADPTRVLWNATFILPPGGREEYVQLLPTYPPNSGSLTACTSA